jgi:dihydropyrimidinase
VRTLFRGGTVVTAAAVVHADVLVDGARIAEVGPDLCPDGAEVVDAAGLYVLPGGIDVHTHLDMPVAGTRSADDFRTGHVAAAFGGTTTHIDFATQEKGAGLRDTLEARRADAGADATIDYGFHLAVTDPTPAALDEIASLPEWGVTSIKLYMAYRNLRVDDGAMLRVLQAAAGAGVLTMVHAENGEAIDVLTAQAVAAGHVHPRYHAATRPAALEAEATGRAIALAAVAGAPLYVVHVTCAEALAQVAGAQARGGRVWAETCVHYLCFTADDLARPDFEGAKYVCAPPLRTAADQEALWGGLREGPLSIVSTDHCPFNFGTQKTLGRDDFTRIPGGVPGIEDRLVVLHHLGVRSGRWPLSRFVDLVATNPARLFGLYPRKGVVAPGADADIVLFDPDAERTLSARMHHMRVDYSLYEGLTVHGAPVGVWRRGEPLIAGDRFVGRPGSGHYLHRAQFEP